MFFKSYCQTRASSWPKVIFPWDGSYTVWFSNGAFSTTRLDKILSLATFHIQYLISTRKRLLYIRWAWVKCLCKDLLESRNINIDAFSYVKVKHYFSSTNPLKSMFNSPAKTPGREHCRQRYKTQLRVCQKQRQCSLTVRLNHASQ